LVDQETVLLLEHIATTISYALYVGDSDCALFMLVLI